MYRMMNFFTSEINKLIEKTGKVPTRAHGLGDVFIGHYNKRHMVFCYKGEFFFLIPDTYTIYDLMASSDGPDFSNMDFRCEYECSLLREKIYHPTNDKVTLRKVESAHDEAPMIFSKRRDGNTIYYDLAYLNERYAHWFEEISEYYGGMTELWTDGKGAFILKRVNGSMLAVALEVRL